MARGLTIIEVLVVLAIFAIISGVVIFNFRGFNDVIYLERLAHDIASQIEKAKRSAISGEGSSYFTVTDPCLFPTGTDRPCKPSYGVHFDKTANPITYFSDLNNDSFYVPAEKIESFSPQTGYSITEICLNPPTPPTVCPLADVANDLTVVFTRPFPDAVLSSAGNLISSAKVKVKSPETRERTITISITGQVSVR